MGRWRHDNRLTFADDVFQNLSTELLLERSECGQRIQPGAPSLRVLCAKVGFHCHTPLGLLGDIREIHARDDSSIAVKGRSARGTMIFAIYYQQRWRYRDISPARRTRWKIASCCAGTAAGVTANPSKPGIPLKHLSESQSVHRRSLLA